MEEPLQLPIRPADDSLQSHLAALDQLATRLSNLTSQTRWPARISLTSKASLAGAIVHTNDVKVHVGDGWWIEMTASEAREYVVRRKTALLEEHARLTDRVTASARVIPPLQSSPNSYLPAAITFDPVFSGPIAGPSRSRNAEEVGTAPVPRSLGGAVPSPAAPQPLLKSTANQPPSNAGDVTSLEDVLEEFVATQKSLAESSGRSHSASTTDPVLNEEGLPIHEIREDEHGEIIGAVPEPIASGSQAPSADPAEDYWSVEAVARREALRRAVFSESLSGSDSDTDTDVEVESSDRRTSWTGKTLAPTPPRSTSPLPSTPTTSAPAPAPSPPPRRPSFNAIPGKSILKPPSARKKSVSFDESVPLPPDSPDPGNRVRTIAGFPTPVSMDDGAISPRPVPIIPPPVPGKAKADAFAGFKRGFLDKPKPVPPPSTPAVSTGVASTAAKGKQPSLFAQRMAQAAVKETAPPPGESVSSSVKSSVVERPPEPVASGSRRHNAAQSIRQPRVAEKENMEDGDGEDESENNEDEEEEEEENEYDIDDALLAREVALEYHRRQGYRSMSHEVDPDLADEDLHAQGSNLDDNEEEHQEDAGNVMLALPRIDSSGRPLIVNPTPDDVRRFVRVGRLENGNLVLAEGEKGWSDDEEVTPNDKEAKRENRERMRRQLLGEEPAGPVSAAAPSAPATAVQKTVQEVGLPPQIATAPMNKAISGTIPSRPEDLPTPQPPKKVSKFKQARSGA